MSNLAGVATVDHVGMVAEGLERVARDLREGKFPVPVRRCIVLVSGPDGPGQDGVGLMHFGADTQLPLLVGLLETAKYQVLQGGDAG